MNTDRVKWARVKLAELGKNQKWLAEKSLTTENTISRFFRGETDLLLSTWDRIEKVLTNQTNRDEY